MNRSRPNTDWPALRTRLFAALLMLAGAAATRAAGRQKPPSSDSVSLRDYVRRVESSYRGVRALRANFTQVYAANGAERTESGIVTLARGGKMRWDYRQPQRKLFLAEGKQLLLYVPAEKQLTRSPENSGEDYRVPFSLLLSRLNLRKVFSRIEFADDALPHPGGERVLRGVPKGGEKSGYQQVLIELDPELNIRRLVITYDDGGAMDFRFDDIERNPVLSGSEFQFTPPPGTEVVDQR